MQNKEIYTNNIDLFIEDLVIDPIKTKVRRLLQVDKKLPKTHGNRVFKVQVAKREGGLVSRYRRIV